MAISDPGEWEGRQSINRREGEVKVRYMDSYTENRVMSTVQLQRKTRNTGNFPQMNDVFPT